MSSTLQTWMTMTHILNRWWLGVKRTYKLIFYIGNKLRFGLKSITNLILLTAIPSLEQHSKTIYEVIDFRGCTWMGDCISMSISADSPSDETLNRGPLALLLRRQYEFHFGINIAQFPIFNHCCLSYNPGINSLLSTRDF